MPLRDYQHESCIEAFNYLQGGGNKVIIQGPTGSGKNYMMGYICNQTDKRGGSATFTVAGRNVVSQFTTSLDTFNIPWTYVMSGERFESQKKFHVSSIDTLHSWFFKSNAKYEKETLAIPDYFLVDEMRLCCTESRGNIIDFYAERGSKVIGFDATPIHARMHQVWDHMIHGKPTPWHIEQGNLSPVVHYSPSQNDEQFMNQLSELKASGDYKESDLAELMDKKVLVGEIVSNYENISMNEYDDYKPFVVSCVNKKHARSVEDAFLNAGHNVEYIDADTPTSERVDMFQRVRDEKTLGIISVLTMSYGVDIPNLCIGINARPSKSLALFLQFGGRILRTHDSKEYSVFIDHAGALREHGYLDDEYKFSLDPDVPVVNETKEERKNNDTPEVDITCSNCMHTYQNSPVCPKCGHENVIDFDQHNVVYVNTDLVREHKEMLDRNAQSAEQWQWLSNMKAAVWANTNLKNDGARINTLNEICRIKFKTQYNPTDIMNLQIGQVSDEAKRYYKHYNMRKVFGARKARQK